MVAIDRLHAELQRLPAIETLLVAFSGGLDSTALLHALRFRNEAQQPLPTVHAVHINHGLQDDAPRWAAHCEQICREWEISFTGITINAQALTGESPEAVAREARYAAFRDMSNVETCLLTAQHADDQAETLLLQLLRGAGPAGLAAMPYRAQFGEGWHVRPLLECTQADLLLYGLINQLQWIEDPSNEDLKFNRNFLRHKVMPPLRERWPSLHKTLGRAAQHQAEIAECLEALALKDLISLTGRLKETLAASAVRALPQVRAKNALRIWLKRKGLPLPDARQLLQIFDDLLSAEIDAQPLMQWPGAELRRYQGDIYAMAPLAPFDSAQELHWDSESPLELPEVGVILMRESLQELGYTGHTRVFQVKFRHGGEMCRPKGAAHRRTLKNLLQEARIPPWERERIPLIYENGRLICVYGRWFCEE